jgi:hypothetical protein
MSAWVLAVTLGSMLNEILLYASGVVVSVLVSVFGGGVYVCVLCVPLVLVICVFPSVLTSVGCVKLLGSFAVVFVPLDVYAELVGCDEIELACVGVVEVVTVPVGAAMLICCPALVPESGIAVPLELYSVGENRLVTVRFVVG